MIIVTTKYEPQDTFGEVLKNLSINYDGTIFHKKNLILHV